MPSDSTNLAQAVARLNRRLRQERHTELTPTQLSVLGSIRVLGRSTPSQVAAHERVQPPSITRAVNCLVEDGHVLRTPHPDDGRQVILEVSDKGEAVLAQERERRDAWLHQRLMTLSTEQRATLREAAILLETLASE